MKLWKLSHGRRYLREVSVVIEHAFQPNNIWIHTTSAKASAPAKMNATLINTNKRKRIASLSCSCRNARKRYSYSSSINLSFFIRSSLSEIFLAFDVTDLSPYFQTRAFVAIGVPDSSSSSYPYELDYSSVVSSSSSSLQLAIESNAFVSDDILARL